MDLISSLRVARPGTPPAFAWTCATASVALLSCVDTEPVLFEIPAPDREQLSVGATIVSADPLRPNPASPNPGSVPPIDPSSMLTAPGNIRIVARSSDSATLSWYDRTDVEDRYELLRSVSGGAPQVIRNYGSLSGEHSFQDNNLSADTLYCYRLVVYRGSASKHSQTQCVYTRDEPRREVIRAQIEITVADIPHAGTDDPINVRLNSPASAPYVPAGNSTWVDYGRDDFERGSTFTYDLQTVDDLSDITLLTIEKHGTDETCLESVRLMLNTTDSGEGVTVFEHVFGSTWANCHWINGNSGHSPMVTFFHDDLRAHPAWPEPSSDWCGDSSDACGLRAFPMSLSTLKSRFEAVAGHLLHFQGNTEWRGNNAFELELIDYRTLFVQLHLKADIPILSNPDVDLWGYAKLKPRFDNDVAISTLELNGVDSNVDFNLLMDALGTAVGLATGAQGSCVNLIDCFELYLEGKAEDEFSPISEEFRIPALNNGDNCRILNLDEGSENLELIGRPCLDFDGDGMPNDWEEEHNLDPNDLTDADLDADGDGATNLEEYERGTNPLCQWPDNHEHYCRDCGPCEEGMADCDNDGECIRGRVCRHNVGDRYGLPSYFDVCECPWAENHPNYCRDCGPCPIGVGDCDRDNECVENSVCADNVGAQYGLPEHYDVCVCRVDPGHPLYCSWCGPCDQGEADCDLDSECAGSLICAEDVGASYGFPENRDVCVCPPPFVCGTSPQSR